MPASVLRAGFVAVLVLLGGCRDRKNEGADRTGPVPFEGDARVTVLLTDAPDDLVHAWVDIREVYLIGGENRDERFDLYAGPTGWIDLLAIGSGTMELAVATVPGGSYSQLLLLVDAAAVQAEDGRLFATEGADPPGEAEPDGVLACPVCAASPSRVTPASRSLTIGSEQETFVLDFEVDESFTFPEDRPDSWSLRPVIRLHGSAAEAD